jgi:hypothetical protein
MVDFLKDRMPTPQVWHFFCASAALSSSSFFTAAFSGLAITG